MGGGDTGATALVAGAADAAGTMNTFAHLGQRTSWPTTSSGALSCD